MEIQQPVLSPAQESAVFQAAGLRVISVATRVRGPRVADLLSDIAGIPVLGAFVSLKKEERLRACMGMFSESLALADAIDGAAVHSAKDDPRFPPISPSELGELDMEVWVLWGMKPILACGKDRAKEIEIGRHGLQISRESNRGLLLPGVATEYGMDVPAFLEAVCRKAGLPVTSWYDDRSHLSTFEGKAFSAPLTTVRITDPEMRRQVEIAGRYQWKDAGDAGPTQAELERLRAICQKKLLDLFDGMRPGHSAPGRFDGNVSGLSVIVEVPDRPLFVCSKIMLRPELRLQASLFDVLRLMVGQIERLGVTRTELDESRLDLAVFWDPRAHGTALNFDLGGLDPGRRAVMVSGPEGWIARYGPTCTPEEIVTDSVAYLKLTDPDGAHVLSMEVACTAPHILVTNMSKRDDYPVRRPAAVAGTFYPAEPDAVARELDRMFAEALGRFPAKETEGPTPLAEPLAGYSAALIPHAGWIYSGALAAATLSRIAIPERVIIFCPKHRPGGLDWAVAPFTFWDFPGGSMESDNEFAAKMTVATDLFQFDPVPHDREHAIEVQLPLLHRLNPATKVIGVTVAPTAWALLADAAAQLAAFLIHLDAYPLLLISSDMNHYSSEEITRKVDRMALDAMLALDPEGLLATVHANGISMCGAGAAALALETVRLCDRLNEAMLVGHTTSAERTGDTSRVVGYAGMLFR